MRRLAAAALLALVLGGCTPASPPNSIRPAAVCEEDQACWDCASMGNGICGLTATENEAELLESRTDNGQR